MWASCLGKGGEEEEVRSGGGGDMRKQSEKRGQVRGSESS